MLIQESNTIRYLNNYLLKHSTISIFLFSLVFNKNQVKNQKQKKVEIRSTIKMISLLKFNELYYNSILQSILLLHQSSFFFLKNFNFTFDSLKNIYIIFNLAYI